MERCGSDDGEEDAAILSASEVVLMCVSVFTM